MIPAVDEFIKKVDIKNNIILITPIQGMFDWFYGGNYDFWYYDTFSRAC
jgi:hypothetical protein